MPTFDPSIVRNHVWNLEGKRLKTQRENSARGTGERNGTASRRMGVAMALGVAVLAWPAFGQLNALPEGLPKALQIGASEDQQIAEYVKANSGKLMDADAKAREKDRSALVAPFGQTGVSTAFRIAYEAKVSAILGDLLKSDNEAIVLNAVVIAGELATDKAAGLIRTASGHVSEPVRTQAAVAVRRTFEAMQSSPVAISAQAAGDLAKLVGDRLAKETSGYAVDAWMKAGFAGATVTRSETPMLRSQAISAIRTGLSSRADLGGDAVLEPMMLQATLRACVELRNQVAGVNSAPALNSAGAKDAAALAGHVIAHAGRVTAKAGFAKAGNEAGAREAYAQLLNSAEMVVIAASSVVDPTRTISQQKIGEALKAATARDDAAVVTNCREVVGSDGLLSRSPWDLRGQFKSP